MKHWLGFTFGKINHHNMEFHYLNIGKAQPLLEQLKELTVDFGIKWDDHEVERFQNYHFGPSYLDFDGAVVNLEVNDENISEVRKDFWEYFIWKTEKMPRVLAIIIPNTNNIGSLTKSQIIEALSLVRLNDRPYEIFEYNDDVANQVIDWLLNMTKVVHKKKRIEEEEIIN